MEQEMKIANTNEKHHTAIHSYTYIVWEKAAGSASYTLLQQKIDVLLRRYELVDTGENVGSSKTMFPIREGGRVALKVVSSSQCSTKDSRIIPGQTTAHSESGGGV